MKTLRHFAAILCVSGPMSLMSQDFDFKGYIKYLQSNLSDNRISSLTTDNLLHNRVALTWYATDHITSELQVRNRVHYGELVKTTPGFSNFLSNDRGLVNLDWTWLDQSTVVGHSNIDRAWMEYRTERFALKTGRQRINWGITLAWNPNDLFNAYNLLDFDYEERPGTDAVRFQVFQTSWSQFDLAIAPSKEKSMSTGALRYVWNWSTYDIQVLGGRYRDGWVAGAGWAGNLRQSGFKGEASYFFNGDSSNALSATVSLDHSFSSGWFATVAWLYTSDPSPVAISSTVAPTARALLPYRHAIYLSGSKALSPLFQFTLSQIYAPSESTWIALPALSYSIANEWTLDLVNQSIFDNIDHGFNDSRFAFFMRLKWNF